MTWSLTEFSSLQCSVWSQTAWWIWSLLGYRQVGFYILIWRPPSKTRKMYIVQMFKHFICGTLITVYNQKFWQNWSVQIWIYLEVILDAQSQDLGQTRTLVFPHIFRVSGQQMTFPGLARLRRLQKNLGQVQEGVLLAKLVSDRIWIPANAERDWRDTALALFKLS